jgi:hypothetical protein
MFHPVLEDGLAVERHIECSNDGSFAKSQYEFSVSINFKSNIDTTLLNEEDLVDLFQSPIDYSSWLFPARLQIL